MSTVFIFIFFRIIYIFVLPDSAKGLALFRGLLSDVFIGGLIYFAIVKPLKPNMQLVVQFILVILLSTNLEHLRVNGAHIDLSFWQYAVSPEFAFGSILIASLFFLVFIMSLSSFGIILLSEKLSNYFLPAGRMKD